MTTLTLQIAENETDIIPTIAALIKKAGGVIVIRSDDDLTDAEFALLKESYKAALLIKKGITKGVPLSELWDD